VWATRFWFAFEGKLSFGEAASIKRCLFRLLLAMDRVASYGSLQELSSLLATIVDDETLTIATRDLIDLLAKTGLSFDDERIASDAAALMEIGKERLTIKEVLNLSKHNGLLETALNNQLVIADFQSTANLLNACFERTLTSNNVRSGRLCSRTPKLSRENPDKVAASFCSIHGQRWDRGEYEERFVVSELCAPLVYMAALDLHGVEKVHKYIGREPSGRSIHDISLDSNSRPFNPFVDAGLIMSSAMIKPEEPLAERFNYIKALWGATIGEKPVSFGNSHYLSERKHSNHSYCLAYLLQGSKSFPKDTASVSFQDMMDFYFMNSCIMATSRDLATFAALLAGGGVCPTTNARIFSPEHVQMCLSMMSSCGMGEFSGSLQFTIGFPCKSSLSGFTVVVIPNLGGFCTYSPVLDKESEISTFGLAFANQFVTQFGLHTFDSFVVQDAHVYNDLFQREVCLAAGADPQKVPKVRTTPGSDLDDLFYCVADGNVWYLRCLFARGLDINFVDYDFRSPLHIAASEGHIECVKLLCAWGANIEAKDRQGNIPLEDAIAEGHAEIEAFLKNPPPFVTCQNARNDYHILGTLGAGTRSTSSSVASNADSIPGDENFEDEAFASPPTLSTKVNSMRKSPQEELTGSRIDVSSGLRTYHMFLDLMSHASEKDGSDDNDEESESSRPAAAISELLLRGKESGTGKVPSPTARDENSLNSNALEQIILSMIQMVPDEEGVEHIVRPTEVDLLNTLYFHGIGTEQDFSELMREFFVAGADSAFSESPSAVLERRLLRPRHNRRSSIGDSSMSVTQSEDAANSRQLTLPRLKYLCEKFPYISKILQGRAAICNFCEFCEDIVSIFDVTKQTRRGDVARYIPQLARQDPEKFAVAVCSIDAQRFSHGDVHDAFCVQSCMKPISYCIAHELVGEDEMHRHVAHEPSGRNFNELTLNKYGLPHNPLINAGAIMTASLILPDVSCEDRFDYVTDVWKDLSGGVTPGYSNETFLSEVHSADRNRCLGYLMKEKGGFPDHVNSPAVLEETLEFYFQMCSLEATAESLSVAAATLANGGVNPITRKRIFRSETVRNCLSIMASSGMYDYAGEFQFSIGVPAKSGVAGALLIVIPNVMGICTWSPRLDRLGNSARGIDFCKLLQEKYTIHRYSLLRGVSKKHDVRDFSKDIYLQRRCQRLIEAATRGDVKALKLCMSEDVALKSADYDGRTAAHLAASSNSSQSALLFLNVLHEAGASMNPIDRWGNRPLDDAERNNNDAAVEFLKSVGAENGHGTRPVKIVPRSVSPSTLAKRSVESKATITKASTLTVDAN